MILKSFITLALISQTTDFSVAASSEKADVSLNLSRISYDNLSDPYDLKVKNQILLDALSEDGIVSITNIPGFAKLKKDTLTWLHACIMDQGDMNRKLTHDDGTVRRTMASITVPGPGGAQPFKFIDDKDGDHLPVSCQKFSSNLTLFRNRVEDSIKDFAHRLSVEMGSSLQKPLMTTEDGGYSFEDIYSVVTEGHHLEHFHSYQKVNEKSQSPATNGLRNEDSEDTIEMHTDQGFFIAFTPGLMVTHKEGNILEPDLSAPLEVSGGFYVEDSHGMQVPIHFDDRDDLIFMMGDGVNQYINPSVKDVPQEERKLIRATPHKVGLVSHDENVARVWYGRMVLPPPLGYNPTEKKTHGQIRSLVNKRDDSSDGNLNIPQGLGCSSPDHMRLLSGADGHSSDINCEDEEAIYCWFRCMSLVDQNVSRAICQERKLNVQCINPREQFSHGKQHGDYYPFCSNTTEAVTPYPKLPTYPADDKVCTDDLWNSYSDGDNFDHTFDLTSKETSAKFMWSVLDDKKTIHGKLTFRGLFGYISIGIANMDPKARHNGMNGARIIMALPGGDKEYSAKDGLDLNKTKSIEEYIIDHQQSSFRHWKTPVTAEGRFLDANVTHDECFTALSFRMDGIHDTLFNVSSTDDLVWAANGVDFYAGHHGRNRARFNVDWQTGTGKMLTVDKPRFGTPTPAPTPTQPPIQPSTQSSAMNLMTNAVGILTIVTFCLQFI